MRRILPIAILTLLLVLPATANAATRPTYAELRAQNMRLVRQNTGLRNIAAARLHRIQILNVDVRVARDQRDAAFASRDLFRKYRDAALVARNQALAAKAAAIVERDTALRGLPDAIAVVPLGEFWAKVLVPAQSAWPCDTYYQGETLISMEFNNLEWCS